MNPKFTKSEKKFWMRRYRIEKEADVPEVLSGLFEVDDDFGDEYF
jgi:hypothetical protein